MSGGSDPRTYRIKTPIQESAYAKVYYNLGSGQFGRRTDFKEGWIKAAKDDVLSKQLMIKDSKITKSLFDLSVTPPIIHVSSKNEKIVIKYLGMTLADLTEAARTLGLSTSTSIININGIAFRVFECLRALHSKGVIHAGITGASFVFGQRRKKEQDKMYIKDFGFSQSFKIITSKSASDNDLSTVVLNESPGIEALDAKDARYLSIDVGRGKASSIKDDYESACYVIFGLLRDLPWTSQAQTVTSREEHLTLADVKSTYTPEVLRLYSNIALTLQGIFRRVRSLDKNEKSLWIESAIQDLKRDGGPDSRPVVWKELCPREQS